MDSVDLDVVLHCDSSYIYIYISFMNIRVLVARETEIHNKDSIEMSLQSAKPFPAHSLSHLLESVDLSIHV